MSAKGKGKTKSGAKPASAKGGKKSKKSGKEEKGDPSEEEKKQNAPSKEVIILPGLRAFDTFKLNEYLPNEEGEAKQADISVRTVPFEQLMMRPAVPKGLQIIQARRQRDTYAKLLAVQKGAAFEDNAFVIEAMRAYPLDYAIQIVACRALCSLCLHHILAPQDFDSFEATLGFKMKEVCTDVFTVQAEAPMTLEQIHKYGSPHANRMQIGEAGGIELIFMALNTFLNQPDLCTAALDAISQLVIYPENHSMCLKKGILDRIIAILRTFPRNFETVDASLTLLWNILCVTSHNSGNMVRVLTNKGFPDLLKQLKKFFADIHHEMNPTTVSYFNDRINLLLHFLAPLAAVPLAASQSMDS